MPTRILVAWIVLIGIQSAGAEERSLVVARRTTAGAIVAAPRAPDRSVVVASREEPVAKDKADTSALLKQKERELASLQAEIKQLKAGLGTDSQILVRVEMLEVSLTKLNRMGTDVGDPNGQTPYLQAWQKALNGRVSAPYDAPDKKSKVRSPNPFIAWLEENRIAKPLCEPNIVVTSGRPGSFHVGGEIPVPNSNDSAVEFRKFGTELDLLATMTDKEHVRMDLRMRLSEIDDAHSFEVNGKKVPALTVRSCSTSVETKFGEAVVLDGMVETRVETVKTSEGMRDEENRILTLFVVTPELVQPIAPPEAEASVVPAPQGLAVASYLTAADSPSKIGIHDLVTVLVDNIPNNDANNAAVDKDISHVHRIAASVVDIRPNGALVIEGKCEVSSGDEVCQHSISGEVRPQSIEPDLTVRREKIAEFRYSIRKTPVSDSVAAPTAIATPKLLRSTSGPSQAIEAVRK